MARFEMPEITGGGAAGVTASPDMMFELGMMYSIGRGVPADRVAAHMWFNLAASRGKREAIAYRRELADEMSEIEIAEAQKKARAFLALN